MTPDLTLDNNATKIRIRLITDIDYVTDIKDWRGKEYYYKQGLFLFHSRNLFHLYIKHKHYNVEKRNKLSGGEFNILGIKNTLTFFGRPPYLTRFKQYLVWLCKKNYRTLNSFQ